MEGLQMPASVAHALAEAGGIRGLAKMMPSERALMDKATHHQSLADHVRLKILWALAKMDMCPCVLKIVTGVTDSKLSYHLRILESAKMIRARRTKNWRVYSITAEGRDAMTAEGVNPR